MFNNPLLNTLNEMKDDHGECLLNVIISRLYNGGMSVREIAITTGLRQKVVFSRLSKELRDLEKQRCEQARLNERKRVVRKKEAGKAPKEIAYEMGISIHKVYRIIREDM